MMESKAKSDITRINFDMPTEEVERLDELQAVTGLSSKKELFNNALSLFEWAVKQVQTGRLIAAINAETDQYAQIVMPAFDRAARYKEVPRIRKILVEE